MQTMGTTGRAGRVRVEEGAKRVRAFLGGEVVADRYRGGEAGAAHHSPRSRRRPDHPQAASSHHFSDEPVGRGIGTH
jgi:hypothetical protein